MIVFISVIAQSRRNQPFPRFFTVISYSVICVICTLTCPSAVCSSRQQSYFYLFIDQSSNLAIMYKNPINLPIILSIIILHSTLLHGAFFFWQEEDQDWFLWKGSKSISHQWRLWWIFPAWDIRRLYFIIIKILLFK